MPNWTTFPEKGDTVHIWVNGIATLPGNPFSRSVRNWNSRAHTHCVCYHKLHSDYLEYLTLPSFSRLMFQGLRADRLRSKFQKFVHKGWKLVGIGHSNGCDVWLDALERDGYPRIEELHFISPACDEDCSRNGVNHMLRTNMLGKLHWYVAEDDWVLWLAYKFRILTRPFGYGFMGAPGVGLKNLDMDIPSVDKRVIRHSRDDFGHSSWFKTENFHRTLGLILGM